MAQNLSKGWKRVDMVRIANERSLSVTFSKRRADIFNNASKLCTLCDVEMAILMLSATNKAYSFGDPCVEAIVNRFLGQTPNPPNLIIAKFMKEVCSARITELNTKLANRG